MPAIFIADPHILDNPKDNKAVEKHLAGLDHTSWLVVAGDITHNGLASEYNEAYRLLSPWVDHCVLMPGNHDVSGRLQGLCWSAEAAARWARFTDDMGAVADLKVGKWLICALDSTNANPNPLELAQGELGDAELNRAREAIEQGHKAGLKVGVCMHHNPVDSPRSAVGRPLSDAEDRFLNWAEKLKDSTKFLELAYGGVNGADLIIVGHTHLHIEYTATVGIPTHMISLGDFRGSTDFYILG